MAKYEIWWCSSDHQAQLPGGEYDSLPEAEAALPKVQEEFLAQGCEDPGFFEIVEVDDQ